MVESGGDEEYEDALKECGFGIFNLCLLLTMFCSACSWEFSVTTVAYVLPVADCDLNISVYQKGILMGFIYFGTVTGAIPLGFCADVFGRRPVLVIGHFVDALLTILLGLSQSWRFLIIVRFFHGIMKCGTYAAAIAYLSEFHTKYLRSVVMMIMNAFFTLSSLIMPVMASLILPSHKTLKIGDFTLNNWNFFLLYTCVPSFIVSVAYFFMPESPKFLLSKGRNEEALKVFQKIYDLNKPRKKGNCPITSFSTPEAEKSDPDEEFCKRVGRKIKEGLKQAKIIFSKLYISKIYLVLAMLLIAACVYENLRLWIPQMFYTMAKIKEMGEDFEGVCMIVEYVQSHPTPKVNCNNEAVTSENYLGDMIHNLVILAIDIVMLLIVKFVESRVIIISTILLSLIFTVIFYFAITHMMVMVVSGLFLSAFDIVYTVILTVSLSISHTQVRAMIVVSILISSDIGTLIGTIVMPHLIAAGCTPLFAYFGAFQMVALSLSIFIPHAKYVAIN